MRVMDGSSQLVGKAHAATTSADVPLKDPLPMALHVPTAPHRPGDRPCFAAWSQQPGELTRPDTLAPHEELRDHAAGLIRVLGDDNWPPDRGSLTSVRSNFAMGWR